MVCNPGKTIGMAVGIEGEGVPEEVKDIVKDVIQEINKKFERRPRGTFEQMKDFAERYVDPGKGFGPGDVVMWKPGMKNVAVPDYGEPCAVLEVSEGSRSACEDSTSCHYDEPCDLRLGVMVDTDRIQGFWYDIKRFQPYAADTTRDEHEAAPTA
ncbi:MAG: hypothetical protein LUG50_13200 [Planctomycetaceae bacterium]|nr:hypothetical protein [Planctomycetaceae bacterium]